ncbi:leucyl/phenylalanyl-tRNA--protein transferase [Nocardioides convexus]|uniref:leucyl/phenylalanyl-tRNA--protein transferase n=1 Tax=Nocardioides convexus TaxID=2712224 RepID=UPI00310157EC
MGWAHSVETWREGRLVGGLYGVAIGGLFAGESMFHHETDASKVALLGLVEGLRADGDARLVDVQWATPHLRSLGVRAIPRADYVAEPGRADRRPPFSDVGRLRSETQDTRSVHRTATRSFPNL